VCIDVQTFKKGVAMEIAFQTLKPLPMEKEVKRDV
jgi:hypothetical protein